MILKTKDVYKIILNDLDKFKIKTRSKRPEKIALPINFLDDEKIVQLSQKEIILYLRLVLTCVDLGKNYVVCTHERLTNWCGGRGVHVTKLLDRFQRFQLLTVDQNTIDENDNAVNVKTGKPKRTKPVKKQEPKGAIAAFSLDQNIAKLLENTPENVQNSWVDTFVGEEFVVQELKKAHVWIITNPQKKPKVFHRFMTNWLNKAYEAHRKGIPSRRMTQSELNAEVAKDLWRRNEEGTL